MPISVVPVLLLLFLCTTGVVLGADTVLDFSDGFAGAGQYLNLNSQQAQNPSYQVSPIHVCVYNPGDSLFVADPGIYPTEQEGQYPCTPGHQWLELLDVSRTPDEFGAVLSKEKIDLAGGFYSSFVYYYVPDLVLLPNQGINPPPRLPPGSGFSFVLYGLNNPTDAPTSFNQGGLQFENPSFVGLSTVWTSTTSTYFSAPTPPLIRLLHSTSAIAGSQITGWFGNISTGGQATRYTIHYDTLAAGGPFLRLYGGQDDALRLSLAVDLSQEYATGDDKSAHVGFTAGSGESQVMASYIHSWNFKAFDSKADVVISCVAAFTLYKNGVELGRGPYTSHIGESFFGLNWQFGVDVIAFQGSANGCLVDVRYSGADISQQPFFSIPSQGLWKCSNELQNGWNTTDFDDTTWDFATELANNALNVNDAPWRHVPNIKDTTLRIWAQDEGSAAYCRLKIPRVCGFETSFSTCIEFEQCGADNLCFCPPPYFGESCNLLGTPSIDTITPNEGTSLGGTTVLVSGYNISSSDKCNFGGTFIAFSSRDGFNTAECISPPQAAQATVQFSIVREQQPTNLLSNAVTFSYTTPMTVTSATPSQTRLDSLVNVTVSGTNFDSQSNLECRFGTDETHIVPATVISTTQLICLTPKRLPGEVLVEVTRNRVDFFSNPEVTFLFYDAVSAFCRPEGKDAREKERFTEVNLADAGFYAFKDNLAQNQTVSASLVPANLLYFNSAEIVDSDFCCPISGQSGGLNCGIQFPPTEQTYSVTVELRTTAFVNQVITMWSDPCLDTPATYALYAELAGEYVPFLQNRSTGGESSCPTILSDFDAASFCIDSFSPRTSQRFRVSFDNTAVNPQSSGVRLFEFAIYGIYLDQPYSLRVANPSTYYNNPEIESAQQVPVSISMEALNVNTVPIPVQPGNSFDVTLQLFKVNGAGELEDITFRLQGPVEDTLTSASTTLFTDTTLPSPIQGNYTFIIKSGSFQAVSIPFTVVPGPFYALASALPLVPVTSDSTALVDPIRICAVDFAGNPTNPPVVTVITISTTSNNLNLAGDLLASIPPTESCVDFSNIQLISPPIGEHILQFEADAIDLFEVILKVIEGPPFSIQFQTTPSSIAFSDERLVRQPVLLVRDQSNNNVGTFGEKRFVEVTAAGAVVSGGQKEIINGLAAFSVLGIQGTINQSFVLEFSVLGFPSISVSSPLAIQGCDVNKVAISDSQCGCVAGKELADDLITCTDCPIGFLKALPGNGDCTPCPALRQASNPGSTRCICNTGYFEKVGEGCVECPLGGLCENGIISGIDTGYFVASDYDPQNVEFYPCNRPNPSISEQKAAAEACPRQTNGLVRECSEGYTGIKCLLCDEGYGHSGPYCQTCPQNYFTGIIITVAIIVLVAFLVFLVQQGKTPKRKETVSAKILLNHIQMLALLSAVGTAWSDPFQTLLLLGGAATFVDSRIIATDCAIQADYFALAGLFMLFPLITLFLTTLVHLIIFLVRAFIVPCFQHDDIVVRKGKLKRALFAQYILSLVVINFITYPAICIKVIEIFDCSIEVGGNNYMNAAPQIDCSSAQYGTWFIVAVVVLALYCIGAPLFALIMLISFRNKANHHIQMVLRFFYDGFKPKRFYWEIVILVRKFLLVLAIILGRLNGPLTQIYGFLMIVQFALLAHILLHPYLSGRQFRLELWSLVAILVTLGATLYIPTLSDEGGERIAGYMLSSVVLVLNLTVIVLFLFFIGRGFLRRVAPIFWEKIAAMYRRRAPKGIQKPTANFQAVLTFFTQVAQGKPEERAEMYKTLDVWWRQAPTYKRRRIMELLTTLASNTPFSGFDRVDNTRDSIDSVDFSSAYEFQSPQ